MYGRHDVVPLILRSCLETTENKKTPKFGVFLFVAMQLIAICYWIAVCDRIDNQQEGHITLYFKGLYDVHP